MGVEPISAGLWKQAQMVPWVLHRVTSILGALPFTQGWEDKVLSLHEMVECDGDKLMQFMMTSKSDELSSSPSPGQIVKALTLAAAGDRWDMERMEILGDAFLKFSTTIFLYYNMSSSCDEGDSVFVQSSVFTAKLRNTEFLNVQLRISYVF